MSYQDVTEDVMTGCHGGCHDGISWRMCLSYGFSKMVKKSCEFLPSIYARHDFYVGSSRFFFVMDDTCLAHDAVGHG